MGFITRPAGTFRFALDGKPDLRTRRVKILVNGIPVNSVGDGNFDPTTIPTEYIESVQVIPGAGSQLSGTAPWPARKIRCAPVPH